MSHERITTSALLIRLFKATNIKRFINHNVEQMKHTPLKVYINSLCVDKGVSAARVIEKSGLDRMYGHQLFNGLRKKPSRDKIIQLAIGFEMDYEETQELLKTARKSALYPRIQRDSVIIFALKNGLSIDDVQSALEELALSPLGKDDD